MSGLILLVMSIARSADHNQPPLDGNASELRRSAGSLGEGGRSAPHHQNVCLSIRRSLDRIELRGLASAGEHRVVRTGLDDPSAVEDDDEIGHSHGGEAM